MDCEKLSPNALKIFEKIKACYPPDSWDNPQWTEDGKVFDNGWHDLRKSEIRNKLIHRHEHFVGHHIFSAFKLAKEKQQELTGCWALNIQTFKRWLEIIDLLYELDFQIETYDLVEGYVDEHPFKAES